MVISAVLESSVIEDSGDSEVPAARVNSGAPMAVGVSSEPVAVTASSLKVSEITDRTEWDAWVNLHSGHPLQLWGWGELKGTGEWTPRRLAIKGAHGSAAAQVLVRKLPYPFRALAYVPRGPAVGADGIGNPALRVAVMQAIVDWCRVNVGGLAVEFEPDWPEGTELPDSKTQPALNTILYPHTLVIDLTKGPDALLKEMRKSTRYDIRKGGRIGLDIHRVTDRNDIRKVMEVYHETANRAGFSLHHDDYYLAIQHSFGDNSRLLAAFDEDGNPCSFAWSIISDTTGFMLYGGRNQIGQKLRANPAIYWAAITDALEQGCTRYDLNGLLGEGITEFKKSFAKHEDHLIGTLVAPINPTLYAAWARALPQAKRYLRAFRERDLKLLKPQDIAVS